MLNLRLVVAISLVALMAHGANLVCGQDYPSKPIRIITSAPGGGSDFDARLIAQGLAGPIGQPVIVDNRAQGILAAEAVAKSPPDGYTLLISGGSLWLAQLFRKAPFDAVRDFSPISLIERQVLVVAVHPSVPVKSVKELIALTKARPGELNFGSSAGVGSTVHLATELFKAMAGVNIVHVPYKGQAPAIMALISGDVQLLILDSSVLEPHVKSGKLRSLAVTSAQPSALVPGLPTVAASVPGYEAVSLTGIFAPAKTPSGIINRLNQEIVRVLNLPEAKGRLLNAGVEAIGSSPEQLRDAVMSDMAKWGKLVRDLGIKPD